jgi:hypothetical protein
VPQSDGFTAPVLWQEDRGLYDGIDATDEEDGMTGWRAKTLVCGTCVLVLSACQQDGEPRAQEMGLMGNCDVSAYTYLIGQPATAAEGIEHDGPVRVLGPTDPMTMDLNPSRLTILLDAERQTIEDVRCG